MYIKHDLFNITVLSNCSSIEDNHIDLEPGTLVHPEDVSYNDPIISEAVQVITPLGKYDM